MRSFTGVINILWDFDGVIMDSMDIRSKGFELVLSEFPKQQVDQLMKFHLSNGGLSRYVKFKYFFEKIRRETADTEKIKFFANQFSVIMLEYLRNPDLLISDSLTFIKNNSRIYNMHIVSGSDEIELNIICKALGIDSYFHSIHGSPEIKSEIIQKLLSFRNYKTAETILIGDSYNDFEAARLNEISFLGYNNEKLIGIGEGYIDSFDNL